MMAMMADELIEVIRNHECLYNPKCKEYKDYAARTTAWEEIAQELNEPIQKCKDDWTKLRNAYASALKRRRNKKRQDATTPIVKWKYEDQIKFLLPYMESRKTRKKRKEPEPELPLDTNSHSSPEFYTIQSQSSSPPSPCSSDWSHRSSTSKQSSSAKNKTILQEIYDLMKSSNELIMQQRQRPMQDMDETDLFFFSMSKAVKALPKLDQSKIKLDLHTAISQAEIRKLTQAERISWTPLKINRVLKTPVKIISSKCVSHYQPTKILGDQPTQPPTSVKTCDSPLLSDSEK